MPIWFRDYSIEDVVSRGKGTMSEHLGIEFTELGDDSITATMPVDHRTKQPAGLLHGGASVALAETLASSAGNLTVDPATHLCVGLEINANHVRSATDGVVTATSRPLHLGKSTQVWETRIEQNFKLICVSRMTLSVIPRRKSTHT